jgi:UDP-glucose 4-epimerase
MKEHILVTGGTGYIGSHTVVELINSGYEVSIVDNLCNSTESVLDGIKKIAGISPSFYNVDLTDEKETINLFQKLKKVDGIIHFAALKAVGESVEKPILYYKNNINSLLNILQCANENNISNLVFSSSCTVYGEPHELPVTENTPIKPAESPYGNTKQICEGIINDTANKSSLKAINLRYFNPIGAHPSALIGELPLGTPNNLIPFITQTAIGKRKKLTVFGDDYNTKDGTCVRDYIHVVDLAKAHIVAMKRLLTNSNKHAVEVFNLGTGNGFSVMEIITTFNKVSGEQLNYEIGPKREGDVSEIYSNTQKATFDLKWKPEETIETMLKSAWNWEKHLKNGN